MILWLSCYAIHMNLNIFCLVALIGFVSVASSAGKKGKNSSGEKQFGNKIRKETKLAEIPDDELAIIFMKSIQALEAFNMRKKYELGDKMLRIVHNMQFASKDQQGNTSGDQTETDIGKSYEIAGSYLKAYEEKGWAEISANVRTAPVFISSKLLILAINNENAPLVKELVDSKLVNIEKGHYERAITVYRDKRSEALETIIDMIVASNPELGPANVMHHKLNLGLAMTEAVKWIMDNDYPMLERALNEGTLKVNTTFPELGSLLGISVVNKCTRCVEILIERGADVNAPILASEAMKFDAMDMEHRPYGWTPLMVAVAEGNLRIIKLLIKSERAFITRTPIGREEERFHARAVARTIKDDYIELKKEIFRELRLNSIEKQNLLTSTKNKTFTDAVRDNNISLVDDFLLLRSEINYIPEVLDIYRSECEVELSELLLSEMILFKSQIPLLL